MAGGHTVRKEQAILLVILCRVYMYREHWRGSTVKEVGLTNEGDTSIVIMQTRDNLRE